MKQILKFQIFVLCCFFNVESMADERWYQIEVIIFSQNPQNTEVFEQISPELNLPDNLAFLSRSEYSLPSLLLNPVAYARVKPEDRLLNDSYNKLRRNNNYQLLLHESWIQPARSNQVNKGVHLGVTGDNADDLLNGILKIQRGHYLHLILDMEYAPGQYTGTSEAMFSEPLIYHLNEKRRLRLNEVHYLDHPKFGIIVIIKPLEI